MTDKCNIQLLEDLGAGTSKESSERAAGAQYELMQRIEKQVEKLRRSDPALPDGIRYMNAAERIAAELKAEAADYEKQALLQTRAMATSKTLMDAHMAQGKSAAKAYLETHNAAGQAAEASGKRAESMYVTELENEGLFAYSILLRNGTQESRDVALELQQLTLKEGGTPGKSGSKMAQKFAQVYRKHMDFYRAQLKEMGFRVADLSGYISKQIWDRDALFRFAKDEADFADQMYSRVRAIGTTEFKDVSEQEAKQLLAKHYLDHTQQTPIDLEVSARNLILERSTYAVRQAQSREIHFNTSDDYVWALETFGNANMSSVLSESLRHIAKNVELNNQLGVNPRLTIESMVQHAIAKGKPGTSQEIKGLSLTNLGATPDAMQTVIDGGYEHNSGSISLAEWSDSLNNFARAVYLSKASITATGDLATVMASLDRVGAKSASGLANTAVRMFESLPPELRAQAGGIIEAETIHKLGVVHRYVTGDTLRGKVYNASLFAVDKTFQYNQLDRITRMNKTSAYLGYQNHLAGLIKDKVPFSKLDKANKAAILRGTITEKEWNALIQEEGLLFDHKGTLFVNTDTKNPRIGAKLNATLAAFVSGEAVITPDVVTRARMYQGTRRGTIPYAFFQQATFLLGYPLAYVRQGFMRQVEATGFASYGMLKLSAALIGLAVIQQVARDAANGRYQDYTDPEVMAQVMAKAVVASGAMTIIGETAWKYAGADRKLHHLIFGANAEHKMPNYGPFELTDLLGGGPLEYLDRVVGGVTGSLWDVLQGDIDAAAARIGKTAQTSLPFVNLPLIKPALSAAVFDPFIEMFEPGRMMEKRRRWERQGGGGQLLDLFTE